MVINNIENITPTVRGDLKSKMIKVFKEFNITISISFLPSNSSTLGNCHNHTSEVIYIIKGESFVDINGKEFKIKAGDYFFVPADIDHKFYSSDNGLELLAFLSPALDPKNPDIKNIASTQERTSNKAI
ncbi:MAG TPA: cupin domain-containing protein [Elusimicrobiales bacterium]|nr:cupin domain-containing protein [Elusimicrobiales bacterium]